MLKIIPASGYRGIGQFIAVPWSIYADDPHWVPPLRLERRIHMSRHNPYFEHAEWQGWIALRDGTAVGRISAQVDHLRLETQQDATGSFGMLEAIDDPEVFQSLFSTAEQWLSSRGMERIEGPYSFSINDECGLLVEGFDTPPSVLMGHAKSYYANHVERCGFEKANDTVAYRMHPDYPMSDTMNKIVERSHRAQRGEFKLRPLSRERLMDDIEILREVFNDAWRDNWHFVPFTDAEFKDVGSMLKSLVDENFIHIGEIDGEPISFIVCLPNINEAIQSLNGRLFPFGWMKLLWRLKIRHPQSVRVALMGIRKEYQRGLLGSGISLSMIRAIKQPVLNKGATEVEMGWILEENKAMRTIIESIGGVVAKRYRIYSKPL